MATLTYGPVEIGIPALLLLDGWAGRREFEVSVVGETSRRLRIRNDQLFPVPLAGRNPWLPPGATALVPHHAIRFTTPAIP